MLNERGLAGAAQRALDHLKYWNATAQNKHVQRTIDDLQRALSALPQGEAMNVCNMCDGTGEYRISACPACNGSGYVAIASSTSTASPTPSTPSSPDARIIEAEIGADHDAIHRSALRHGEPTIAAATDALVAFTKLTREEAGGLAEIVLSIVRSLPQEGQ